MVEVWAFDACPGLGSHVAGDQRLDGRLGQALMGIQAIKGVEIGAGFALAREPGRPRPTTRSSTPPSAASTARTNRAGGIEGGMTNGAPVRGAGGDEADLHAARGRCASVDVATKEPRKAVRALGHLRRRRRRRVVAEAVVAFVLAQALMEKFGGDSIAHLDAAVERYRARGGAVTRCAGSS